MTPEAQRIVIAEIPLTRGFIARVDATDVDRISDYKWRVKRNGRTNYAISDTGGKRTWMHRLILGIDSRIHHKDDDGLNNCRKNLEVCSNTNNIRKKRPNLNGTSRFKGVSWYYRTSKWQVTIKVDGRSIAVGHFDSEEEAARAYDAAARKHFGEYAYQNFPHKDPSEFWRTFM